LDPRCHVGFSIAGPSLDFDKISTTLTQRSVQTGRAGSVNVLSEVLTEDIWKMTSPLEPLKALDEHLRWLRQQLEKHVDYLRDLSRTARLRVHIGFTFSQEQNGFTISPEFVRFFASFNASIDVFIICNFGGDFTERSAGGQRFRRVSGD
jgi:hypothetical protein